MSKAPATIFHIAERAALKSADSTGHYRASSLDSEGFIHCCTATQLEGVVSRYYAGQLDLTLLVLNTETLEPAPVMENTVGGDELFPHLYGEIPTTAIKKTIKFNAESVTEIVLD